MLKFIKELINRFGEDRGTLMALRAEVGFLRRYMEKHSNPDFIKEQEVMTEDFLARHPKP